MPAPTLVILAAGASRRYGRPKQLDPLGPNGETIMELTARDAVAAGADRIVLVVSKTTGEEVASRMQAAARQAGWPDAVRIEAVRQRLDDLPEGHAVPAGRTRPWGTAHALRSARSVSGDGAPVVVVNADDWYGPDAITRIVEWATTGAPGGSTTGGSAHSTTAGRSAAGSNAAGSNADASARVLPRGAAALVPYPLAVSLPPAASASEGPDDRGVSRGLLRAGADGRLVHLAEHVHLRRDPADPTRAIGEAPGGSSVRVSLDHLCSMNLWGFGPAIWGVLDGGYRRFLDRVLHGEDGAGDLEWLLPDAVLAAVRTGELDVRVLDPGTAHLGVTHPEDRARVRESLASAIRP